MYPQPLGDCTLRTRSQNVAFALMCYSGLGMALIVYVRGLP